MPTACWLKHLCSIRALVPVSCFLSLSLSLSLPLSLFQADPLEHRGSQSSLSCPGFLDFLDKALWAFTPSRGRLRPLWTVQVLCRGFIGFLVNQGISASFSLLYFLISQLGTTRFWSIKGPQQVWVYFGTLYSVPLIYMFVFVPVPYYFDDCSFIL